MLPVTRPKLYTTRLCVVCMLVWVLATVVGAAAWDTPHPGCFNCVEGAPWAGCPPPPGLGFTDWVPAGGVPAAWTHPPRHASLVVSVGPGVDPVAASPLVALLTAALPASGLNATALPVTRLCPGPGLSLGLGPDPCSSASVRDVVTQVAIACAADCVTLPCTRIWVGVLASAGTLPGDLPPVTVRVVACVPLPPALGPPRPHATLNSSWRVTPGRGAASEAWMAGLCSPNGTLGCGPPRPDGSTRCVPSPAAATSPPSCVCGGGGWAPGPTPVPLPPLRPELETSTCEPGFASAHPLLVLTTTDATQQPASATNLAAWLGNAASVGWHLQGFGNDAAWAGPGVATRTGPGMWMALADAAVVVTPFRVATVCCAEAPLTAGMQLPTLPPVGDNLVPSSTEPFSALNATLGAVPDVATAFPAAVAATLDGVGPHPEEVMPPPGATPWQPAQVVLGALLGHGPRVHLGTLVVVGTRNSTLSPEFVAEAAASAVANTTVPWDDVAPVQAAAVSPDDAALGGAALHVAIVRWLSCVGAGVSVHGGATLPAAAGWEVATWVADPLGQHLAAVLVAWASPARPTVQSPARASGATPIRVSVTGRSNATMRWVDMTASGAAGAGLASLSSGLVTPVAGGCGALEWHVSGDGSGAPPAGTPTLDDLFAGWFTAECVAPPTPVPVPSPTPPVPTQLLWAALGVVCPAGSVLDVALEVCTSDCTSETGYVPGPCVGPEVAQPSPGPVCPEGAVPSPDDAELCVSPEGLCGPWGYLVAPGDGPSWCECWRGAADTRCTAPQLACGSGAVVPADNVTMCVCDPDAEPGPVGVFEHAPGEGCVLGFDSGGDLPPEVSPEAAPSPEPVCGQGLQGWTGFTTGSDCGCVGGTDPATGCVACTRDTVWNGTACVAAPGPSCGPHGSRVTNGTCVCAAPTVLACGQSTRPCCVSPAEALQGPVCGPNAVVLPTSGVCACVPGAVGAGGSMVPPCELVDADTYLLPVPVFVLQPGLPGWLTTAGDVFVAVATAFLAAVTALTLGRMSHFLVVRARVHRYTPIHP